jgi:UDPglucose 6-dehydrogenase
MNIGMVGLGKLGMDAAEVFATKNTVYGYDIYPKESDTVNVCRTVEDCINKSDWIFVAVETPHSKEYDGSIPSAHLTPKDFDYGVVKSVLTQINKYATADKNIVLISTVLPGTTRREFDNLLDNHTLIYNPYLIAMGTVKWDMVNPEMLIIGSKDADDPRVAELISIYEPIMENSPRYECGTWEEAEAIKIFYNTYISAKIGIVNMIQDFAMKIGHMNVDVVTDAMAHSDIRLQSPKYMTAGMGDAGACHPRDNIALRWLAQNYDLGYDMFSTIMGAREVQAENLANFLVAQAKEKDLLVVIHGKAYKPDIEYCIGSYSTLVGHYVSEAGAIVKYIDPLADNTDDVISSVDGPVVLLLAHNRKVTYGYVTEHSDSDLNDGFYTSIPAGSIIVDPWRKMDTNNDKYTVVYYGDTRNIENT